MTPIINAGASPEGNPLQVDLDDIAFVSETSLTIRGPRRRTTVPKEIVEHLHLGDGDRIRWILFSDGKVLVALAGATASKSGRPKRRH